MNRGIFIIKGNQVLKEEGFEKGGFLGIKNDRIVKVSDRSRSFDCEFKNHILYPSLINSHDHLLGSYFPRVGDRRPYLTWKPWDDDLKGSKIYKERGKHENIDLYYLGAYRNLISGALTVSDHIPHIVNESFIPKMPIRVLSEYALAHEVSSYDLKWGDGVEVEYRKALEKDIPFITHIEEGFDEESGKGIEYLKEMDALGEHTVLVHGIALSDEDIKDIGERGSHLVWCPFSNNYMFGRTARVKELMRNGVNVSIGTDSPMSGALNLLEEVRFAKSIYYEMYREELSDRDLVRMVIQNPAKALRLGEDLGGLDVGKKGDFIAIRNDMGYDGYELLVRCELKDISMIFYNGEPLYGDEEYLNIFEDFGKESELIFVEGVGKRISVERSPLELLRLIQERVGYKKELPFLPIS